MAGFAHADATHGQLVIDTVEFMAPNRRCRNLQSLFGGGTVRGSDIIIPGVNGVKPRRRRLTATEHALQLVLRGDVDDTGAVTADPHEALDDLIAVFVALADPPTSGDGTKSATLTFRNGDTSTRDITPLGFEVGDLAGPHAVFAVFDLSIPAGRF